MHEQNAAVYSVAPNLDYHRNRARALLNALKAGRNMLSLSFVFFIPMDPLRTVPGLSRWQTHN